MEVSLKKNKLRATRVFKEFQNCTSVAYGCTGTKHQSETRQHCLNHGVPDKPDPNLHRLAITVAATGKDKEMLPKVQARYDILYPSVLVQPLMWTRRFDVGVSITLGDF